MTRAGVALFTILSGVFGAGWGALTSNENRLGGALAGAVIGLFLGYLIWDSMRMREMP